LSEAVIRELLSMVKSRPLSRVIQSIGYAVVRELGLGLILYNEVEAAEPPGGDGVPVGVFIQCSLIPLHNLTNPRIRGDWGDAVIQLLGKSLHHMVISTMASDRCVEGPELSVRIGDWVLMGKPDLDCGDHLIEIKTVAGRLNRARVIHDLLQAGFYALASGRSTLILYLIIEDYIKGSVTIEAEPEMGKLVLHAFKLWAESMSRNGAGALTIKTTSCSICKFRELCSSRTRNPAEVVIHGRDLFDTYIGEVIDKLTKAGASMG
jgi:hypothetical protein